jgi:hypothetical protein
MGQTLGDFIARVAPAIVFPITAITANVVTVDNAGLPEVLARSPVYTILVEMLWIVTGAVVVADTGRLARE